MTVAASASADCFVERLTELRAPVDVEWARRFFRTDDEFLGARMGQVFALAKEFIEMNLDELDRLLDSTVHEVRVGALSIMGKQAVRKTTSDDHRRALYELYLRRIDRVDTWDLVDISAHQVIGGYLIDSPRDVLYRLAGSPNWPERRIAMFATLQLVRAGDLDDTFAIAEILVADEHDLIHKVVGGLLREAGKHDRPRLRRFLDRHAEHMPRVALRHAIEHFDPDLRRTYLNRTKEST